MHRNKKFLKGAGVRIKIEISKNKRKQKDEKLCINETNDKKLENLNEFKNILCEKKNVQFVF